MAGGAPVDLELMSPCRRTRAADELAPPGDNHTKVFSFDEYEVDVGRRELRHRGEHIVTQARVLNLLVHLIEHRDRAVDNSMRRSVQIEVE